MKKIISLFSAVAVVSSMFATFATTSFAAASTDSKPEIQGIVESVDGDNYAIMKFKLVNNEALSYETGRKGTTSNGINAIQIKVTLDSNVFDTTETYIMGGFTGVNLSGKGTDTLTMVFAPTSVDTYMINVPEYLIEIDALLKDGYTMDNIPSSAVTFGETMVEYISYANQDPAVDAPATYTKYYVNSVSSCDYPLTVGFTGTAKDEPTPDPEPEVPTAQSVQTSVFEPAVGDYVEITLTDAEGTQKGDSVKFSLPDNVKGKATKVLGFLKYTIGVAGEGREAPAAGDILTAVLMNLTEGAKATIATETVK